MDDLMEIYATEMGLMACKGCGCEQMHLDRVEIFHRVDDEPRGSRVSVRGLASMWDYPSKLTTFHDIRAPMEKGSLNPSSRRGGVRIEFLCEECSAVTVLRIAQHKGSEILSNARVVKQAVRND